MNKNKRIKSYIDNAVNVNSKSTQSVKLCRLCETKDGPFLNIFDTDMDLSSKIDSLLPITVTEYDDLPHKVCFRCSAKLSDLHEFVNKCVETQESLSKSLKKSIPIATSKSTKTKKIWSERLTKNKISNNAFCEELIQKALESVGKGVLDILKDADYKRASATLTESKLSIKNNLNTAFNVKNKKDAKENKDTDKRDTKDSIDIRDNTDAKDSTAIKDNTDAKDINNAKQSIVKIHAQTTNNIPISSSLKNKAVEPNKASEVIVVKENKTEELSRSTRNENKKCLSQPVYKQNIDAKELEIVKNASEDPDFEKDVRICISRVNSDHSSKKDQHTVKNDKKFTTFKVAGVGNVFSCENCNRIFLSKEKISGHVCVTDISKSTKESDISNRRVSNIETKGSKKAFEKELEKPEFIKEKFPETYKRKLPGPASKTLNVEKNNENNNPSQPVINVEPLTVDSIMKSLINNQMHYQLVPGPNNTLVLQASPQTINIPINLSGISQVQSLTSVPAPIVSDATITPNITITPNTIKTPNTTITPNTTKTPNTTIKNADSSGSKSSNSKEFLPQQNSNEHASPAVEPSVSLSRGRRKATQSQVSVPSSVQPIVNLNSSITRGPSSRVVNTQTPSSVQKNNPIHHVPSVISSQFPTVPLNSPAVKGPFPVALTKNLYSSDSSTAVASVDVDNFTSGTSKRKSRDIPERAKRAKINPEVIDLEDDDVESVPAFDDLLVERPKRRRGRPPAEKKTNNTEPQSSQTYRVVPNNNPRKLIISAVASASTSKRETKRNTVPNNDQSDNSSKGSRKKDNLFFAHLMDRDTPETLIPDKTMVQESQITTTVSARASKGRGASSRESVGSLKCMMCNMAFTDNSKLSAHMKIHYASWI